MSSSRHQRLPRRQSQHPSSSSPLTMSSTRVTRSSVLGKRGHQQDESSTPKSVQQLQTPEPTPNPKRAKTSTGTVFDGESNKENIPPHRLEPVNTDSTTASARPTRALRRVVTEVMMTAGERPGKLLLVFEHNARKLTTTIRSSETRLGIFHLSLNADQGS